MINHTKRSSTRMALFLASFYILALFAYGFIKTFLHTDILVDITGFVFIIYVLYKSRLRIKDSYPQKGLRILLIVFCLSCGFISIVNSYSARLSILGFRNYVVFLLFGIAFSYFRYERDYIQVFKYIRIIGTLICAFAIFQYIFFDYLPDTLLYYVRARFEGVYGLSASTLYRVTGLLQNTIVFGGFSAIITMINFAEIAIYNENKKIISLILLIISATSTLLSFGRIAIAGAIAGILIIYYISGKTKKLRRFFKILLALSFGIAIVYFFFGDTALISRMLGRGESTSVSNTGHQLMILTAIQAIRDNWLIGVGMGTQGYFRGDLQTYITDGCWFSLTLEMGIPLIILFIMLVISLLRFAFVRIKKEGSKSALYINCVFISVALYFLFANIINSSFTAPTNYGLFWVIAGCMLGVNDVEEVKASQNGAV